MSETAEGAWSERPAREEFSSYYRAYVDRPPDGDILRTLRLQIDQTIAPLLSLPAGAEARLMASGTWSLGDTVGHLADFERVMAFRALWFARSAPGTLGSMEQDEWVPLAGAARRPLRESVRDLASVREATVRMFESFDPAARMRAGVAAGSTVSVRALAWIIAGHELHHRAALEAACAGARSGTG